MIPEKEITEYVRRAIEESLISAIELQTGEAPPPIRESTVIVGAGGLLDSMGFVNFLVALENALEERWGRSIDIIALVQKQGAATTNTVGALIEVLAKP